MGEEKIVEFPKSELGKSEVSDEEKARRITVEVDRLTRLPTVEWQYYCKHASAEKLGLTPEFLRQLVEAKLKDIAAEKRAAEAEKRQQEVRVERQRRSAERAEECKRKTEQEAIDKAARAKEKAKTKALGDISKLPVAQHEMKLTELATKLDLDLLALRDEFAELIEGGKESSEPSLWDVEPWEEAVPTAEVLSALIAKFAKHIAAEPHEIITLALWAMTTWVYQDVARHSTFLLLTSADPEFGKTTALEVLNFTVLRPSLDTETTGPTLYRFVDQAKPTMLMDEVEDLLKRRDIKAIIQKSHSREGTIKRQERVQGRLVTVQFSPWCPKAFALVGLNVPPATISRSIVIQFWPKLPNSEVAFSRTDDEEFAVLRQKLARWAGDHIILLKQAKEPLFPAGIDNRPADLWRLLLLVAELAGGDWAQQAREAAERLSRSRPTPSWRRLLLQTIARMAADDRKYVLSEALQIELLSDPTSPWQEYENKRGHIGRITQRQIAHLLDGLEVRPTPCGPRRLQGYVVADFRKAFAHYRIPSSTPNLKKLSR